MANQYTLSLDLSSWGASPVSVVIGGYGYGQTIGGGAVDSVNGQIGTVVLDADDIDDALTVNKFATATQLAKVDNITITQAVDLDTIEARVNALDAAVVLKGSWDATSGLFPGGGTAQAGESWIVSGAGTVDGVDFTINDRIVALVDNAPTGIYATNWLKLDYTDQVISVVGLTGAIAKANLLSALNVEDGATADLTAAEIEALLDAYYGGTSWRTGGGTGGATYHNATGATLTKGTPIALGSFDVTSGNPGMIAADADGSGTMPCLGILGADVVNGANGIPVLTGGEITGLDTSGYSLGDKLYVSATAGALTNVRPSTGFIQGVAVVSRVDAVNGEIIVALEEAGTLFTEVLERAVSDETTALTTGAAKLTFRMPYAMTLTEVRASVATAPTGAALQIDVNDGGISIFSTPVTVDAGEKTSVTAAVPAVISDPALADDAEVTIDIDQVGSTVAGAGLKIVLLGYR